MQKIAIISVNAAGAAIAATLQQKLQATAIERNDVARCWHDFDAFIFIGAMGICVRTIAPLVEDKHTDPAVVCVDSCGHHAVAVLSGHIGGANDLTKTVAEALDANPVITTQSDNQGLWALDTLGQRFGWRADHDYEMNEIIAAFVNRKPTALFLEIRDEGTDYMERTLPSHVTIIHDLSEAENYPVLIAVTPFVRHFPDPLKVMVLHFMPKVLTVGFGLAHHPDDYLHIPDEMLASMYRNGMEWAIREFCTIDVKQDEPMVGFLRELREEVRFFTADELAAVEVPTPSATVERHVGTPSVCEAAALLGSHHGKLLLTKVKGQHWTMAVAIDRQYLRPSSAPISPAVPSAAVPAGSPAGHIEIVGAGPGDPDLISVRGRHFLERADLILYAGSLVPKALTLCHKPGAVVRSSADMNLNEQCALMKEHYDRGHLIVRLHTGDPCIFGAIQEQMAFFDREGMSYHITPGISSFLAAAAELRSQFTIPERTQTIILTRGEGRTPMPEREKLHLLARSQSTMCIFLSAAIVDDVQRQLLQEYPEDTPVAACYHLTWPDQRIYRGQLKDLASIVHDNHLTLTTMLVVGEAIDNRHGLSRLYDGSFSHLYRSSQE